MSKPDFIPLFKCITSVSSRNHDGVLFEVTVQMDARQCSDLSRNFIITNIE